jgi:lipopolysaccharide biosynthesis protein
MNIILRIIHFVIRALTFVFDKFRRLFVDCSLEHYKVTAPGTLRLYPGLLAGDSDAIEHARGIIGEFPLKPVAVDDKLNVLSNSITDFKDKRVALVAHWDPDGLVDPYVLEYFSALKTIGYTTILATENKLRQAEEISPVIDAIVWRKCDGYDFTSWKAAFEAFPSLYEAHEVTLTNDSVFAPIGSLEPMYHAMDDIACDFWGATESPQFMPHLQSFFLVFRQTVLRHKAFYEFWQGVPLSSDRNLAISCEIRLTLWLALHSLRPAAFIPHAHGDISDINPSCDYWKQILLAGVPFIKRELLFRNARNASIIGWEKILIQKKYPIDLIYNYAARTGNTL